MASRIEIFFPVKEEVIHTVIERGVLFGIGGPAGQGVPAGGSTGQQLRKKSGTDFDTEWFTPENLVTPGDIANWNAAYGWGNHAAAGYLTSAAAAAGYQPLNAGLTALAALSGTGLVRKTGANAYALDTNNYLTNETDPLFQASAAAGISSGNISNWNAAFSWGNHASAGYLTSETDPVFAASPASGITNTNISNWNTAFGWGNHASAGYLSSVSAAALYQPLDGDLTSIAGLVGTSGLLRKTGANTWSLDTNTYLTSYTETDPVFGASAAAGITYGNISNWNSAFSWGNHASAGYATTASVAAGYQPLDGDLTSIAGLAGTSGLLRKTGANTWTLETTAYIDQAGARSAISLTTTGTSGAATYNSSTGVLNIPQYASSGSLTVGTSAIGSGTAGRILFEGTGNVLQESANLLWDETNSRLSVGGAAATSTRLTVYSSGTNSFSFVGKNSVGSDRFTIGDNGDAYFYSASGTVRIIPTTGIYTYSLLSQNGGSRINIDGGLMDFYNNSNALIFRIFSTGNYFNSTLTIGTNAAPNASAVLDLVSTTQGLLVPRMTTTQRNAISSPAAGLVLYNTTTGYLTYRNASGWVEIGSGGSETDPVFSASAAFGISSGDISNWNAAFGWGNHASAGYITSSSTSTLTNKRITQRVTTITSSATPTVNTDNCDAVDITALAADITSMTTNLSGTPTNFQRLLYRIKDNGSARAINWGASFVALGVALPTTTVAGKILTVGFIHDTTTGKWGCIASAQEA